MSERDALKAPFPWFGGKSAIAPLLWAKFGAIRNYVEPFFGSGAVLLARPRPLEGPETINDLDGFVANAWRAIAHDPAATANHADWPVNECDLTARHAWLVGQRETLTARLMGDPEYYDPKVAGWWLWGISAWIGSGWCSGSGPWQAIDGQLVDTRQPPHLGTAGMGVHRQRPHLSNAGMGLDDYFAKLAARLRHVRVCCGDWSRVLGPSVTIKHAGITGVFLDPPYASEAERTPDLYAKDCLRVAVDVRDWALTHGNNPRLRICLCGYDGEHAMPPSWTAAPWCAPGGYGSQSNKRGRSNRKREVLWFSPHCLRRDAAPTMTVQHALEL
jgi:hypothetical protein